MADILTKQRNHVQMCLKIKKGTYKENTLRNPRRLQADRIAVVEY